MFHRYSSNNNSDSSGASVDEERMEPGANCRFGRDPVFEEEKAKLAERISSLGGMTTGDYDHKTRILERIGGGSFGEVYLGEMVDTKYRVAVKVEPAACAFQSLLHEGNVYRKLQNSCGIPRVYWYGLHGREFAAMVMDLMGPTLYERWAECGERFSLKTVLMLADQMVEVMEQVHGNNFVHRDISPNNFMFGLGDKSLQVHLIDFGHAKEVPNAPQFIPARRGSRFTHLTPPMVGTPRFASVFTHMGLEPSYRDDMESLGYIWIYLLKGRLPWQGIRPTQQQSKIDLIAKKKFETSLEILCEGIPQEFGVYMNYVRSLKHLEMPNHAQIREFFRELADSQKIEYDWKFDWIKEKKVGEGLSEEGADLENDVERLKSLMINADNRSISGYSGRTEMSNSDTNVSK